MLVRENIGIQKSLMMYYRRNSAKINGKAVKVLHCQYFTLSLSTVVLNSRDCHENLWFQIFRTFKNHLTIGFSRK